MHMAGSAVMDSEYMMLASGVPSDISEPICEMLELPSPLIVVGQPHGLDMIVYVRGPSMPHELGASHTLRVDMMAIADAHGGSLSVWSSMSLSSVS